MCFAWVFVVSGMFDKEDLCVHVYVRMHVCVCVCVYVRMCVYVCMRV